jgi:hypothetical protein
MVLTTLLSVLASIATVGKCTHLKFFTDLTVRIVSVHVNTASTIALVVTEATAVRNTTLQQTANNSIILLSYDTLISSASALDTLTAHK